MKKQSVAWESFDEPGLEKYFMFGIQELFRRLHDISDLNLHLEDNKTKELFFMLESLLYVRSLIVEVTTFD
ncbi:MAG: hypothetical protein ABIT47_01765 [Candidatus Paceibacterota bacterium]